MNKLFTFFSALAFGTGAISQTTVYETGNGTTDGWTGWSTPVVTNCTGSVNGVNHYQFSGSASDNYTIETYRQFNINTNDMDIYFDCLTQDATFGIEYSTDNVTYTPIQSMTVGTGYAISSLIIPTYDPVVSTFYLKIVVSGTFGSPSSTNLYYMKIDAVPSTSEVEENAFDSKVFYANNIVNITTSMQDYQVNIYDITGTRIASNKNLTQFDMSAYQAGVYFVGITNKSGEQKTFKIVHK